MFNKIKYLFAFILIPALASAQEISNKISPFMFKFSYTGEFANNLSGGITTGNKYLGFANVNLNLKTEVAGLWTGGEFNILGANTHGGFPSSQLYGDFQTASNIDADNFTYIQEFWYKHEFGDLTVIAGLQDININYLVSENGSLFLNSSFGVPSTISANLPVPIFPLTAIGLEFQFTFADNSLWQIGVFDGNPTSFDKNPYNTSWEINANDGIFWITEIQTKIGAGVYKLGTYYHSNLLENDENDVEVTVFDENYGFYGLFDYTLIEPVNEMNGFNIFGQLAFCPKAINNHFLYIGFGLQYLGLFNNSDALGLGVANAMFNESVAGNETAIELTYKTQITENIFIQPDVQYILNPGGVDYDFDNVLAATIRFGLTF